jgi:hypothetical protein
MREGNNNMTLASRKMVTTHYISLTVVHSLLSTSGQLYVTALAPRLTITFLRRQGTTMHRIIPIVCIATLGIGAFAKAGEPPMTPVIKMTRAVKAEEGARRCAFLGRFGSFHVFQNNGTAAYYLGPTPYIADLAPSREDNRYWYYRPVGNGDPETTEWAFSRQPDRCGQYWVWRFARGGWRRYEPTKAWGDGLGSVATVTSSADVIGQLQLRVDDIDARLRKIENP